MLWAGLKYRSVQKIAEVRLYSPTKISFELVSGGELRVWDGHAHLVPKGCASAACQVALCRSDVTCAAFKIADEASATAYMRKAVAALDAAKVDASRARRRLARMEAAAPLQQTEAPARAQRRLQYGFDWFPDASAASDDDDCEDDNAIDPFAAGMAWPTQYADAATTTTDEASPSPPATSDTAADAQTGGTADVFTPPDSWGGADLYASPDTSGGAADPYAQPAGADLYAGGGAGQYTGGDQLSAGGAWPSDAAEADDQYFINPNAFGAEDAATGFLTREPPPLIFSLHGAQQH